MINIKLTKKQLNNLKVFLQRTQLRGFEVAAFIELFNLLNNAEMTNGGEDSK